jgi:excisionase family DNA binding protein
MTMDYQINDADKLLTIKDAAVFLTCSVKTLYNAVWRGELKGIGSGRFRRFTKEELVRFLQKGERNAEQKEDEGTCNSNLVQLSHARAALTIGQLPSTSMANDAENLSANSPSERKAKCVAAFSKRLAS